MADNGYLTRLLDWGLEKSLGAEEQRDVQKRKYDLLLNGELGEGPQIPAFDQFKRSLDELSGFEDYQGLPTTRKEAQMRGLQGTLGIGGAALGMADPTDEATAMAARKLAEGVGLGETGQSIAELLSGLATGAGAGDVKRAALLGSPKVLGRITRDVVEPISKKFKPGSETAQAMQGVLTGPRPIHVAEVPQALSGGRPVAGTYGIPGGRTAPEERALTLTTVGDPDYSMARGPRRHEVGHAVHEEKPMDVQHRITKATKEGDLPLNPMMTRHLSYRKLPDTIKGNENYSMWLDDFLSGKMEWDAGQLARAPGNLEYKRATKALEWFKDNEEVILGQSIPINETTRRWAQLRALQLP